MSETLPTLCERCGYDLEGLRQAGTCPECGNRYDKRKRDGIARHRSSPATARPTSKSAAMRALALLVASLLTAVGGLAMGIVAEKTWGPIIVMGMIALLLAMGALASALEARRAD